MKTVVTGGAGFIGSHLVKRLLEEGREVVIVDDFSRGSVQNLLDLGINPSYVGLSDIGLRTSGYKVDLRDYDRALKVIEGGDTVYHLSARVGSVEWLHGSETAELEALQTNLLIDTNTFRACLQNRVRKIIYASSVSVYPIHTQYQPNVIFSESDLDLKALTSDLGHRTSDLGLRTINPEGGYGWAKLLGEIQLLWMKGIEIGIARIFNIYGENGALGESSQVIPALITKAINYPKEEFIVWGDGRQSRDFLYVSDCVDALLKLEASLSERKTSDIGHRTLTVNIGSDQEVTIGSLAEKIVELSGKDIRIEYDPSKPTGPISRTADITKARTLLNWQPKVDLEEGLRRTYAWLVKRLQER